MARPVPAPERILPAVAQAWPDEQAARVGDLVKANGQRFDYQSFPEMDHFLQAQDPDLYARVVTDWIATLD